MYVPIDISVCFWSYTYLGFNSNSSQVTMFSESQVPFSVKWDGNNQGCYVS